LRIKLGAKVVIFRGRGQEEERQEGRRAGRRKLSKV
jgi:hypothetical protein